jgi:hypothetical protein
MIETEGLCSTATASNKDISIETGILYENGGFNTMCI